MNNPFLVQIAYCAQYLFHVWGNNFFSESSSFLDLLEQLSSAAELWDYDEVFFIFVKIVHSDDVRMVQI